MPKQSAVGAKKASRKLRCAIYTRKSTEEGLEQDFNLLDAQREACEAFIASQKHEGDGLRARLPGKEIVLHRDGNVLDHIRAGLSLFLPRGLG